MSGLLGAQLPGAVAQDVALPLAVFQAVALARVALSTQQNLNRWRKDSNDLEPDDLEHARTEAPTEML